jgi:hypothetical protein
VLEEPADARWRIVRIRDSSGCHHPQSYEEREGNQQRTGSSNRLPAKQSGEQAGQDEREKRADRYLPTENNAAGKADEQ